MTVATAQEVKMGTNASGTPYRMLSNDAMQPVRLTYEQTIEALEKNNRMALDDHQGGKVAVKIYGVGFFRTQYGKEHTVCLCAKDYFSINPIYVDDEDGLPHLDRWSVGGVYVPAEMPALDSGELIHIGLGTILKTHIFK